MGSDVHVKYTPLLPICRGFLLSPFYCWFGWRSLKSNPFWVCLSICLSVRLGARHVLSPFSIVSSRHELVKNDWSPFHDAPFRLIAVVILPRPCSPHPCLAFCYTTPSDVVRYWLISLFSLLHHFFPFLNFSSGVPSLSPFWRRFHTFDACYDEKWAIEQWCLT